MQTPILCAIVFLFALPLQAINITLDYQYDTNNFFGAGNPDGATAGAEAKATLEAVADYYSGILTDTFSSIETPAPFVGQFDTLTWQWSATFLNPQTGISTIRYDDIIPADEYRLYVGARSLSGNTLGFGGPGGWGFNPMSNGIGFTPSESAVINPINDSFLDAVENREETSGFANWGGAVTFDSDAGTNWHYDLLSQPTPGSNDNDFFSVAVHEIGHALGLGTSNEWNDLISGGFFFGSASQAENGSPVPLDCDVNGCGHWADGTSSVIYGTATSQEAALDPTITTEERKQLTALDAAGLTDIGWTLVPPVIYDPADYNEDGYVDGTDFAIWENWLGINGNGSADGDSDTDGLDFLLWQQGYTGPPPAFSGLTTIPEPSSLALGALGVLLYLRSRRNHS